MAYTALYRKWRPQTFDDVRGQEHIVTALRNQLSSDRVGHAYLFCGTRGTGKTSVAKILARAVNCQHPVNGNPCNECPTCKAILAGSSVNVVEIDAASNNGVENIREIRDEVRYSPTEGRYRVYIIDEVHMLSTGAFNALLKTLEEPPSYVIFILATTEVHRIPITVLSRCQRYDFRRIGTDTLQDQLKRLTDAEGIRIEDKALRYVARMGDGSMRDAQSLLEQCAAFYFGETLTYENVLEVLGAVDTSVFSRLLRCILQYDVSGCIALLDEISGQGRDLTQFVTDFLWYMRNLLLLQTGANAEDALDMSADNLAALKEEARQMDTDTLIRYIRLLSDLSGRLKFASAKRVLLEVTLIKLMKPEMERDSEAVLARLSRVEEQLASVQTGVPVPVSSPERAVDKGDPDARRASSPATSQVKKIPVSPAVFEDFQMIADNWTRLANTQGKLIASFLRTCEPGYSREKGFEIICPDGWTYMMLQNQEYLDSLSAAVERELNKAVTFSVRQRSAEEPAVELIKDGRIPGIEMDIGIEES